MIFTPCEVSLADVPEFIDSIEYIDDFDDFFHKKFLIIFN